MPLTLDLSPETETWLEQEAAKRGLSKNQFVVSLIESHRDDPALMSFEELTRRMYERPEFTEAWIKAAQERWNSMTPEEQAALEAQDQDFLNSLNENRRLAGQYRML
jgi:hypothetical protein